MQLSSPAFGEGEAIPARHSCDGRDFSPPLNIEDIPEGTAALALIMDDPDAAGTWDHWVAYDIPVTATVPEGAASLGTPGRNSWRRTRYGGPCPPSGRTHRYFFRVYALDAPLGLGEGAAKGEVLQAMEGHVLAEATLMGRYSRR